MKAPKKLYGILAGGSLLLIALLFLAWPVLSVYYDGYFTNVLAKGTLTVQGDAALPSASVGAGEIADPTRSFSLPLGAAFVDGTGPILSSTAPNLTTLDNIPAVLWDDSGETTGVTWTFRLPSDFSSGLVVYALVSSNEASGTGTKLDWQIWVNDDDTGFDAAAIAQNAVECASASLDASNEVLTLTADATAEAAYTSGSWVSLEFFNASTNDDDLELKGLEVTYTATQ